MTSPRLPLRVAALLAVLGNVAFNATYDALGVGVGSIGAISDRYQNLFVPAGYAFAIWGAIYLAFLAYTLGALLPAQRTQPAHDAIAPPLIAANVLCSVWIATFVFDQPVLAALVLLATLACAIVAYRRVEAGVRGGLSVLWRIPFSLFLGWVSVATIAGVTIALVSLGASPRSSPWAITALALAVALGVAMALRFRDVVVPLVIAWASFALTGRGGPFGTLALVAGITSCAVAGIALLRRARRSRGEPGS